MNAGIEMSRQEGIFVPESGSSVAIVGCGAIGSCVGIALAKLGVKKFHLFDDDVIGIENVAAQFYDKGSIGKYKVHELGECIRDYSPWGVGMDIRTYTTKIEVLPSKCDAVFLCVDSLEARKKIMSSDSRFTGEDTLFTRSEKRPFVFDIRVGNEYGEIWSINRNPGTTCLSLYLKSLDAIPVPVPCSQRMIIYMPMFVVSIAVFLFKEVMSGRKVKFVERLNIGGVVELFGGGQNTD